MSRNEGNTKRSTDEELQPSSTTLTQEQDGPPKPRTARWPSFTLAGMLWFLAFVALLSAYAATRRSLVLAERELAVLRKETGYLGPIEPGEIAAVRLTSDEPMTYQFRVRVPEGEKYRVVYSSVWQSDASSPSWYAAVNVPAGESVVIVRILRDMRDDRWKIVTLRRSGSQTRRVATVLPPDQVRVFRGSYDSLRAGIGEEATIVKTGKSIRLLDDRILAGEGAMMLYGDQPPEEDMIGVLPNYSRTWAPSEPLDS